jgi:hypothetical protein
VPDESDQDERANTHCTLLPSVLLNSLGASRDHSQTEDLMMSVPLCSLGHRKLARPTPLVNQSTTQKVHHHFCHLRMRNRLDRDLRKNLNADVHEHLGLVMGSGG